MITMAGPIYLFRRWTGINICCIIKGSRATFQTLKTPPLKLVWRIIKKVLLQPGFLTIITMVGLIYWYPTISSDTALPIMQVWRPKVSLSPKQGTYFFTGTIVMG